MGTPGGIAVALAIVFLVVMLSISLWAMSRAGQNFHPAAVSLQALITAAAVILAGGWYLVERRGAAQADIELDVAGARLEGDAVLVEAKVTIHNRGQILLKPAQWDVQLLGLVPANGLPVAAAVEAGGRLPEEWPALIDAQPLYSAEGEARWRGLRRYFERADLEVEPGEKDVKMFDFLIPCTIGAAVVSVRLRKPPPTFMWEREPEGGRWWRDRGLVGLAALCAGPPGTVAALGPADDDKQEEEK
jgi:hypothetical protein